MSTWIKVLRNTLFLLILITFSVHFSPIILTKISDKISITDEQIGDFLSTLEILLSTMLAISSFVDQKVVERRCVYNFSIEKNSLSLQEYIRFSTNIDNTFVCFYKKDNDEIQTPYYGMLVEFEKNASCSVGIPLCMEVSTTLDGEKITFSHVRVCARNQGQILKGKKLSQGSIIEMPIQDGRKYIIRLLLMCNHEIERKLLDSCIYLTFVLVLNDSRGRKIKKYIFIEVQNRLGENRIVSISSKDNWFAYMRKLVNHQYQLYLKSRE